MSLLRWMCVLALASMVGACGDDSGDSEPQEVPEPISMEVTAEDGANIDTEGAEISIPGGALSEDTEVTVEVILPTGQPDADKLASLIYDFGPDGTTFEMPVELTIELNKSVPEGMEATMAWLDEDAEEWMPLADSVVKGETVVATTTHFTKFAIVLTATDGQTAGACEDFADFEACGGDIAGTWEFTLACADLTLASIFGEDNEIATCDGVVLSATVDISGSVTFEEGGAYDSEIERDFSLAVDIPLECIPGGAPCSALGGSEDGPMVVEEDGVCMLSQDPAAETETEAGTYELSGDTLIMTAEGEEADEPNECCVEGNTITVRIVDIDEEDGQETVTFFQATRQ
jgi:hypothetical protein